MGRDLTVIKKYGKNAISEVGREQAQAIDKQARAIDNQAKAMKELVSDGKEQAQAIDRTLRELVSGVISAVTSMSAASKPSTCFCSLEEFLIY